MQDSFPTGLDLDFGGQAVTVSLPFHWHNIGRDLQYRLPDGDPYGLSHMAFSSLHAAMAVAFPSSCSEEELQLNGYAFGGYHSDNLDYGPGYACLQLLALGRADHDYSLPSGLEPYYQISSHAASNGLSIYAENLNFELTRAIVEQGDDGDDDEDGDSTEDVYENVQLPGPDMTTVGRIEGKSDVSLWDEAADPGVEHVVPILTIFRTSYSLCADHDRSFWRQAKDGETGEEYDLVPDNLWSSGPDDTFGVVALFHAPVCHYVTSVLDVFGKRWLALYEEINDNHRSIDNSIDSHHRQAKTPGSSHSLCNNTLRRLSGSLIGTHDQTIGLQRRDPSPSDVVENEGWNAILHKALMGHDQGWQPLIDEARSLFDHELAPYLRGRALDRLSDSLAYRDLGIDALLEAERINLNSAIVQLMFAENVTADLLSDGAYGSQSMLVSVAHFVIAAFILIDNGSPDSQLMPAVLEVMALYQSLHHIAFDTTQAVVDAYLRSRPGDDGPPDVSFDPIVPWIGYCPPSQAVPSSSSLRGLFSRPITFLSPDLNSIPGDHDFPAGKVPERFSILQCYTMGLRRLHSGAISPFALLGHATTIKSSAMFEPNLGGTGYRQLVPLGLACFDAFAREQPGFNLSLPGGGPSARVPTHGLLGPDPSSIRQRLLQSLQDLALKSEAYRSIFTRPPMLFRLDFEGCDLGQDLEEFSEYSGGRRQRRECMTVHHGRKFPDGSFLPYGSPSNTYTGGRACLGAINVPATSLDPFEFSAHLAGSFARAVGNFDLSSTADLIRTRLHYAFAALHGYDNCPDTYVAARGSGDPPPAWTATSAFCRESDAKTHGVRAYFHSIVEVLIASIYGNTTVAERHSHASRQLPLVAPAPLVHAKGDPPSFTASSPLARAIFPSHFSATLTRVTVPQPSSDGADGPPLVLDAFLAHDQTQRPWLFDLHGQPIGQAPDDLQFQPLSSSSDNV